MGLLQQLKTIRTPGEDSACAIHTPAMLGRTETATSDDYEAISGVSLELYTAIAKGIAAIGYDSSRGPEVAASHGVGAESWREAFAGWNGRIKRSPEVAGRFNALYTGRA
ncbi:MAG TPA: hypothetical protein VGG41_03965 [Solirubrobacteraceae bacterium]|jgi:hypothetical protein